MNKPGAIIESSIYNDLPLKDHIEELCNPKVIVTHQDTVNLLLKYFFGHRYPNSIDLKVNLCEIEELFSIAEVYFEGSKVEGGAVLHTTDRRVGEDIKHFQGNGYGLAMLGDASSSIAIFKSIIDQNLDIKKFDEKYFGLDLGSGSGWLLLAQYIQAIRNGFTDIENWGIEINDSAAISSNILASKLQIGSIIIGDTTDEDIYMRLPQDRKISHISNENIPTNGVRMCGSNDPFHQNNIALFGGCLKGKITQYTSFFPNKINMLLDLGDQFKQPLLGEKSNGFGFAHLLKFEEYLREAEKKGDMTLSADDKWNIFHSVYPLGIDTGNGKMVRLDEIGIELLSKGLEKGLVNRLPGWRKRWEKEI